jgi:hypothetical protein
MTWWSTARRWNPTLSVTPLSLDLTSRVSFAELGALLE